MKRETHTAVVPMVPTIPLGMTQQDAIDALLELRDMAAVAEKQKDPSFNRWPDLDALLAHMAVHGLPPFPGPVEQAGRPMPEGCSSSVLSIKG